VNLRKRKRSARKPISQKKLLALQEAILALHECHDREAFLRAVPGIFLKLTPNYDERDELLFRLVRPHYEQVCRRIRQDEAQPNANGNSRASYGLTTRQTEVASWLAGGKSNSEIARILGNSVRTVEKHLEAILAKLKVENRTAAALALAGS
jgi:DNA-binding NarL/FixJ family response regulator